MWLFPGLLGPLERVSRKQRELERAHEMGAEAEEHATSCQQAFKLFQYLKR